MDQPLIQKIIEAVESGNQRSLNSLLGCQQNVAIGSALITSTDGATKLLDTWRSRLKASSPTSGGSITLTEGFQALLMIRSCYITPWEAMSDMVKHCQHWEMNDLYRCVSSAEMFLKEASRWTTSKDYEPGCQEFIRGAVKGTIDQLLSDTSCCPGDRFKLLGDFLVALLGFAKRTFNEPTNEELRQYMVSHRPPSLTFHMWLRLVYKLRFIVTAGDMDGVYKATLAHMNTHGSGLPTTALVSVLDISLSVAKTTMIGADQVPKQKLSDWYRIPIDALTCMATRQADYAMLENHLSSTLATMPLKELNEFWKVLKTVAIGVDWVEMSVLLLVYHCASTSTVRVSSDILFPDTKPRDSCNELVTECQSRLLELLLPKDATNEQLGLSGQIKDDETLIVEVLGDLTYAGDGMIIDPDGGSVPLLSKAAKLLLNVVWIGRLHETESYADSTHVATRNNKMLRLADLMLCGRTEVPDSRAMLFYIILQTILYHELPPCRLELGNSFRRGLLSESKTTILKNSCLAAVALIVGSTGLDTVLDPAALEPCVSLLLQPLDSETFMQLVASLSASHVGRNAVLSGSKTLLSRGYSNSWERSTMSDANGESVVRAGLLGLLELVRSSPWQLLELEAWAILSNCIVMDAPHLLVSDRTWLYEQLLVLLADEDLSPSSSIHFCRAATARLARFILIDNSPDVPASFVPENAFIVWEDPSTLSTRTIQTEDIISLLRLSLTFFFRVNGLEVDDTMVATRQAHFHEQVLNRVLFLLNEEAHSVEGRGSPKSSAKSLGAPNADVLSDQGSFLSQFLLVVCDYLSPLMRAPNEEESHFERDMGSILKNERDVLASGSISEYGSAFSPNWWAADTDNLFSTREVDVEPSFLLKIDLALCELFIEVLCGPLLQIYLKQEKSPELCRNMVLAVGRVLGLKQNIASSAVEVDGDEDDPGNAFGVPAVFQAAAEFFSAASRAVQDLVTQKSSLEEADEIFTSISLFCKAVDEVPSGVVVEGWQSILQSLWTMYHVVGSEKGASRLVSYLESKVTVESVGSKTDASISSLKSMRSSEDVDASIQRIRLGILRALATNLRIASACGPLTTAESPESEFKVVNQAEHSEISFITSILRALVHDLRIGLEGQSGGITAEMYESYLDSIQTCVLIVYQFSMQVDSFIFEACFSVFVEVIAVVREILQTFPLEDATLFRSSLIVAIAGIPAFSRELLRRHLLFTPMNNSKVRELMNPESELVRGLFDEGLDILRRWSALRDPNSVPWDNIAGKLHVSDVEVEITSSPPAMDEAVAVERTIEARLRTKSLWSWSLSCTFVALEEQWLESFRSMVMFSKSSRKTIDNNCQSRLLHFFSCRQQDLHTTLSWSGQLFAFSTAAPDSPIQQVALDMLAMNLPSAPRLRFCHLIATTSKVLKYSIDQLCALLDPILEAADPTMCFLEAMSTVAAWLVFDESKSDFAVGTFRWLSILRRKRPPGENPGKGSDNTNLLPWVTKASFLVRDLHGGLRNLQRALNRSPVGSNTVFEAFFPGGRAEMLRLTAQKLRLLELTMPSEYCAPTLPDFPSLGGAKRPRKNRPRRQVSALRRKKRAATHTTKSRNRIVNAFLRLDKKSGDDGGKDDAFVDLEDFLVEG